MEADLTAEKLCRPARILPLSHQTAFNIVATSLIPDLQTAVLGLVQNGLEAGANRITVVIDFPTSSCEVQDNGCGILSSEFGPDGGLCRPHHSSKHIPHRILDEGSIPGVFLASVASVSLLKIASKACGERGGASVTIHHCKVLRRHTQADLADGCELKAHGTKVVIKDLFGNIPVRLKQRSLAANPSRHDESCWNQIRSSIVASLLAWHKPCVVKIMDATNSQKPITLAPIHPETSHALTAAALRGSVTFSLRHKLNILSQAKLCGAIESDAWIPVKASTTSTTLRGHICLEPSPHRLCQFISMDGRPVTASSNAALLYDIINKTFQSSTFGAIEHALNPIKPVAKQNQQRGGLCKTADRHPMFVIALTTSDTTKTSTNTSSSSSIEQLSSLIIKSTQKWLQANSFMIVGLHHQRFARAESHPPASQDHNSINVLPSISKRRTGSRSTESAWIQASKELQFSSRSTSEHALDTHSWSRIRAGRTIDGNGGQAVDTETTQTFASADKSGDYAEDQMRDVSSDHARVSTPALDDSHARNQQHVIHTHGRADVGMLQRTTTQSHNPSLSKLLDSFQSPLFTASTEKAIPVSVPEINLVAANSHSRQGLRSAIAEINAGHLLKLSREDLKHVTVIRQVDAKFVLCQTAYESVRPRLLFVIDQHAASERVILESLLRETVRSSASKDGTATSRINVTRLEKPIVFETTSHEYEAFVRRVADFAIWGITYDTLSYTEAMTASQVRISPASYRIVVKALPSVIVERCRLAPRILIDLLRSEVWDMVPPTTAETDSTIEDLGTSSSVQSAWLTMMSRCPKGLLEMINSRACRSAIMFNDVLSHEQCVDLVQQLSQTLFPFICAHGRTSIAPLFSLGGTFNTQPAAGQQPLADDQTSHDLRAETSFTEAFTSWQEQISGD